MIDLDACGYMKLSGMICGLPTVWWAHRKINGTTKIRGWCREHVNQPMVWQLWTEGLTREEAEVWMIMES